MTVLFLISNHGCPDRFLLSAVPVRARWWHIALPHMLSRYLSYFGMSIPTFLDAVLQVLADVDPLPAPVFDGEDAFAFYPITALHFRFGLGPV